MITAGVDLSSQAARTALCVVDWSSDTATVVEVAVGAPDQAIERLFDSVDKLGIDVPLGWPVAFAEAVACHSRNGSWPAAYVHANAVEYRFRRTDIWVWKALRSSPPLSVSTDRIALPAMRAAALLSRLSGHVPLDGSGVVVEAYPAAALRRWGFSSRGYKRAQNLPARRLLVGSFYQAVSGWLRAGEQEIGLLFASDDAFDALVAALVARAAALGLVEPIPEEDRRFALREGWIAVPCTGSLSLLPGPVESGPCRPRL